MALGSIIGAAGSLLGGLFGSKSQKKQIQAQIAAQKEFAQHGVEWKVQDAKRAGIHPLAALGAQTHAFSPIGVGSDYTLSQGMADAGQQLGSALSAGRTKVEKAMQTLQLQRAGLENKLLEVQIANMSRIGLMNQPGRQVTVPPVGGQAQLIDGQAASDLVNVQPMDLTATQAGRPYSEPAAVADIGYLHTSRGGRAPVFSEQAKERLEEDLIGSILWSARNRLMPAIGVNQTPPADDPGEGNVWVYDPISAEYVPVRSDIARPWSELGKKIGKPRLNIGRGKVW